MKHDLAVLAYDASAEAALEAVRTYSGPMLIDFDETLYLRNSTEDFLDCARPGLLALLLLRILDVLKPWRLSGGMDTRDNWRVCAISILLPWTARAWRATAPGYAARHLNRELAAALLSGPPPRQFVLTSGFKPIVEPLLIEMGFADRVLIAARPYSFADRRRGKHRMAAARLGLDALGRSLVVTDSLNDMELLGMCARPFRTQWSGARYVPALSRVYLPGEYVSKIKHPGERYILRGIIQEDFALWILSSIFLAADPAALIVGLSLLLLSFWAIYERGYVENDLAAFEYERNPNLSDVFATTRVARPAMQPWVWASLAGACGVAVLHDGRLPLLMQGVLWASVLVLTYACFALYNRVDKMTRVWLYPLLQLARSAAFTVVVPIAPAAVAAIGAHVLSRWMSYQIYRFAGGRWPEARPELARLISFILLSAIANRSVEQSNQANWAGLGLLLWCLFRARRDIRAVFTAGCRIDQHSTPAVSCKAEMTK